MSRILHVSIILLFASAMVGAQNTPKKKSIEGVWKIVEVVGTGADAFTDSNPQPSLLIVTRGHYSQALVTGDKARILFEAMPPTDAEKLAAYNSFLANTGTYELNGTTLTIHPLVARIPNYMAGGSTKYTVRLEGNNLWLTERSSDTTFNVGGKIAPLSGPSSETKTKYVRVE